MINNLLVIVLLFLLIKNVLSYEQKFDMRVLDGQKLDPRRNKHLIYLEIADADYSTNNWPIEISLCSGSIISENWILTAAHCFFSRIVKDETKNGSEQDPNKYSTNVNVLHKNHGQFGRIAKSAEVYLKDPSFLIDHQSTQSSEKDLALLKTQKRIKFSSFIQPISLATRSIKVGNSAIISGYGEIDRGVFGASQGLVKMRSCPFTRGTTLLCSKEVVRAGEGDSGGSLVFKGKLVGVTSKSCSHYLYVSKPCATIYVNVPVNLSWIKTVTGIDKRF